MTLGDNIMWGHQATERTENFSRGIMFFWRNTHLAPGASLFLHRLSQTRRRFAQCHSHPGWEQLLASSPVWSVSAPQIRGQGNHAQVQVSRNTEVSYSFFHVGQFTRSNNMQGDWYGSQGLQGWARQLQLNFWQRKKILYSTRVTIILRTILTLPWSTRLVCRENWPGKAQRNASSLWGRCGKRGSWSLSENTTTGHFVRTSIGRDQGLEVHGWYIE